MIPDKDLIPNNGGWWWIKYLNGDVRPVHVGWREKPGYYEKGGDYVFLKCKCKDDQILYCEKFKGMWLGPVNPEPMKASGE